jgi:hypothetical protein
MVDAGGGLPGPPRTEARAGPAPGRGGPGVKSHRDSPRGSGRMGRGARNRRNIAAGALGLALAQSPDPRGEGNLIPATDGGGGRRGRAGRVREGASVMGEAGGGQGGGWERRAGGGGAAARAAGGGGGETPAGRGVGGGRAPGAWGAGGGGNDGGCVGGGRQPEGVPGRENRRGRGGEEGGRGGGVRGVGGGRVARLGE